MPGYNHHPWCQCGWCVGGHGGGNGGGGRVSFPIEPSSRTHYGQAESPSYATIQSFTDPNALCPVCKAHVYFYRSPYNGRVFFDHLGPPWPKHHCTDAGRREPTVGQFIERLVAPALAPPPIWSRKGWQPFLVHETSEIPSLPGCFRIRGTFKDRRKELFVRIPRWPEAALVQARMTRDGRFQLSVVEIEGDGQTHVHDLSASENVGDLMSKTKRTTDGATPDRASAGAMALALQKAMSKKGSSR